MKSTYGKRAVASKGPNAACAADTIFVYWGQIFAGVETLAYHDGRHIFWAARVYVVPMSPAAAGETWGTRRFAGNHGHVKALNGRATADPRDGGQAFGSAEVRFAQDDSWVGDGLDGWFGERDWAEIWTINFLCWNRLP